MLSSSTSNITNNEPPFQIPSIFGTEEDTFVQQEFTAKDHFFPNVNVADFPLLQNFNQEFSIDLDDKNSVGLDGNALICDPLLMNLLHPRWKKPDAVINKHRHRKIVTAQGSRDRRVRLSIQIARRFFDLQDNLGNDKASQTIAWLLDKSKSAIEEIAKIKQSRCSTIASNELEKIIEGAEIGGGLKRNSSVSSSSTSSVAKEIEISMQQQNSISLAKELRAKARERARERTKAKMSVKKLVELRKLGSGFGPIIPNSRYQFSSYKMVPYFSSSERSHSIAELISTTKKSNAQQNFTTNQQNFTSSRQVPSSAIITKNWEISNNVSQEIPSATGIYL